MPMRLIEPILFPICIYPLEIFKFAGKHNIENFDVISNFGYQKHHLNLVNRYIDPELIESFIDLMGSSSQSGYKSTEEFVEDVDAYLGKEEKVYEFYYRYFLTRYILECNRYEHDIEHLIYWADEDKDFTFKKCFKYKTDFKIKDYYNTIIIPRLWDKVQLNNITWINKMYGLLPISYTQSKVIKLAGEHLIEGGRIYVLREEDYGKIFWELGDDFDIEFKEPYWSFTKKESPKKSKTNEINWL